MQPFKIQHFERDHPGEKYPRAERLTDADAALCALRLASILPRILSSDPLPGLDANADTFQLADVWQKTGITPHDDLLLSFDVLKTVETMRKTDVEKHFADIWYPVSDDLLIFDRSAAWLLYVHHDGYICVGR